MSKSRRKGHNRRERQPSQQSGRPGASNLAAMDEYFASRQKEPDRSDTDSIMDLLQQDAGAGKNPEFDPDLPRKPDGPWYQSHTERGDRDHDVLVERHAKGFVHDVDHPDLEPLPERRRRKSTEAIDFEGQDGAFEEGEIVVGEEPAPQSDPAVDKRIVELVEEIADLRKRARQLRELGEDAASDTCGDGQLISKDDTWWQKAIKIFGNMQPVDPYECMGGDQWRKTANARADELDAEADELEKELDGLLDQAP